MITIKLMGGMGNQMWQYAFGLAQARRLGVELQVDTSHLGGKRPLALNQWQIELNLVERQMPTITEQGMGYNQELVNRIKDGDVLQGYWQNEKYINSIEEDLREFVFVPRASINRSLKLLNSNSVAVHIRRGDYLQEPHKSFHGVLSLKYYLDAFTRIWDERGLDAQFFIFSDDTEWVKKEFGSERFIFMPSKLEAEDIYLMSLCKHAVIANSSFSWWGAWLGDGKENRIVIAPKKWFDQANEDYSGIVPDRWVKI